MTQYSTVVADPPWYYESGCWDRQVSRSSSHYETLDPSEMAALPVESVVADDAYLFLWVPNRHLLEGLGADVARAWGFRPLTCFAWCKPQMGLGYYVRNSHENVVFGVRGSPGPFNSRDWWSWFVADRQRHSAKPEVFLERVEKYCDGPYLELFARKPRDGWTVWGNEVGDPFGWGFDPEQWAVNRVHRRH